MKALDRVTLGVALALTAGPPLVDVIDGGVAAAVRYSAADAFYYNTVARNLARLGRASFDGIFPANGFHPLWQLTLGAVYRVCALAGAGDGGFVVASIVLSIALVTLAAALFSGAFLRSRERVPVLVALLPLGVYGALMAPVWYRAIDLLHIRNSIEGPEPLYGTMWSFMNGMESPLALALFGVLAWRFSRRAPRSAVVDAVCLAALTLARLDLALVAVPLLVYAVVGALRASRWRQALGAPAVYGCALAAYLAINKAYAGMAMPVSGAAKLSFPHLATSNLDGLRIVATRFASDAEAYFLTWRSAQILMPAAAVVLLAPLLAVRPRWAGGWRVRLFPADPLDRFLAVTGSGVLALAAFDLAFVHFWDQGHWYFPVSIAWISLAVASLVDRAGRRHVVASCAALAVIAGASLFVFVRLHRRTAYHADQAHLLVHADVVRKHFRDKPKIMELDDGIVAFATDFPTIAAFGLDVDREAASAIAEGRLYPLGYSRGFSNVAVFSYNGTDYAHMTPSEVNGMGQRIVGWQYNVSLEYAMPNTRLAILGFRPR